MDRSAETSRIPTVNDLRADSARAANALKCPQCGTKYELVSKKPTILRILGLGNRFFQRAGRMVTLMGAAGIVGVFASGVYALSTVYGSWAVKQFIGREMHALLLTDEPDNWRWTTFINLPSIPFALILARFQPPRLIPSIIPILLLWPPIPPVHLHEAFASKRSNSFTPSSLLPADLRTSRSLSATLWSWPPTPALFGFIIVPLVRFVYRKAWTRLQIRVLGAVPASARTDTVVWDGWPIVIRIRGNINAQGGGAQQDVRAEGGQQQRDGQVEPALEVQDQDPAQPQDQVPEEGLPPLEAAEQNITVMRSSLGRRIGGALLIPYISARMGALLLAVSKHSVILRQILAVRPPLQLVSTLGDGRTQTAGIAGHIQTSLQKVWQLTMRGSAAWAEADPVWWRNAIGLGLFAIAKDAVELLHLWLATRELESRHVKNRDFSGVDIRELDLIPGFLRATPSFRTQQQRARSLPRGF
ncbi:hypothetical protein H0H87_008525 [Tephrocybe sp. NHM501043]|nr:hypothetical protein H0H87_008525 [Tephrocybe sp. NHM501043]